MTLPGAPATRRGRILLLTPRWPYPVIGGDRLRVWHLARQLAQQHHITLLSLCQTREEMEAPLPDDGVFTAVHRVHLPRWRSWLQMATALPTSTPLQVAYYRSSHYRTEVNRLLPGHDLLACHLVRMAPYAEAASVPRWLEMTDAVSLTMARAAAVRGALFNPRRWAYRLEARRMQACEKRGLAEFDLVSLVSAVDAQTLAAADDPRLQIAPNGVDLASQALLPAGLRAQNMALVGRMDSLANRDAMWFFVREVLPAVRKAVPMAELHLIGHVVPADRSRLLRVPGVRVVGTVPRLEDALKHCRVGVCPVRIGAGLQNKVLDYMAHGLACISSPIGLEGHALTPGREAVCADTIGEWVTQTTRLLMDDEYSSALGECGAAWARQHGSWQDALAPLLDRVDALVTRRPAAADASSSVG